MDLGLLILRVVFGLTLTAHSVQKLFGWFGGPGIAGTAQMMEQHGFRPPRLQAVVAGLVEGGAGLALAADLLTPLAAAAFISVMFVATVSVHLPKGFFNQNGGFEYTLALAAGALAVPSRVRALYPLTRRLGSIGQALPGALLRSRSGSWVAACS
jgi:putative oxidoreductase